MANILAVGLGGFIGSILRYLIGLIQVSEVCIFPIKTFVINIVHKNIKKNKKIY